jgi:hypothetical protein
MTQPFLGKVVSLREKQGYEWKMKMYIHDCSRYVERVFWVVKGNI